MLRTSRALLVVVLSVIAGSGCVRPVEPAPRTLSHFTPAGPNIVLDTAGQQVLAASDRGYFAWLPEDNPQGSLVFIQGSRADSSSQLDEFAVVPAALRAHLAVIFVSTGNPVDFLFHPADLESTVQLVNEARTAAGAGERPYVVAGLSLSGTRAMRYTRYCLELPGAGHTPPAGVVLCDAPLDMVRFWNADRKAIAHNVSDIAVNEATWVNAYLEKELHATPQQDPSAYLVYSPYSRSNTDPQALALFAHVPLRAYHEPDVDWWIAHRGKDYYDMNSVDLAGLVNELRMGGNTQAELITSTHARKGAQQDSSPHTWSIVESEDLVHWASALMR